MKIRLVLCPECKSMQQNNTICPICKCPINKLSERELKRANKELIIEDLELEDRKQIRGYYSQLYQEEQEE